MQYSVINYDVQIDADTHEVIHQKMKVECPTEQDAIDFVAAYENEWGTVLPVPSNPENIHPATLPLIVYWYLNNFWILHFTWWKILP